MGESLQHSVRMAVLLPIKCYGADGKLSWDTVGRRAGVGDEGGGVGGGVGSGHFEFGRVGFDVVRWPGWLIFTLGSSKMGNETRRMN